ncbi:TetR/AcrR family transcriptional regulator [uncultured Maricaulis sp.]|uniref:TetR/AcrR family transcriptional regulator n=1 Tax=uncultured Maricaulis sp. TaxID=174710 RepID=UPI0030DB5C48|tara:strand:+ start:7401 stop:8000 length:600 start_codon:yes stop_codon:yes gene_type:complete
MSDQTLTKGGRTRERVLETAAQLFQCQGYAATGINQIVTASGQPRGSLYFHFPGGKQEIATEAARQSADTVSALIEVVFATSPTPIEALTTICTAFADQLRATDFQQGCPLTPLATSITPESGALQGVCAQAYDNWMARLRGGLEGYGMPAAVTGSLASLLLSAIEGAILLSRTCRNTDALDQLPQSLLPLLQRPEEPD